MQRAKTRRCKAPQCSVRFEPNPPWIEHCSTDCGAALGILRIEKAKAAKAKADRKNISERKEKMKTRSDWIKAAQVAFNAFIRERDRYQLCICCDKLLQATAVGGGYDCGHYRSVGSAPHLRFDERNAHGQTKQCNRYGAGRAVDYRINLKIRIGIEAVEELEANNEPRKYTIDELRAIQALYRAKLKELK